MFAFCKATDKEKVGTSRQVAWINGAKLVAILAVLVDHTNGVLYINQEFALASYFSVALFVLLSGMTSYMTNWQLQYIWLFRHKDLTFLCIYIICFTLILVARITLYCYMFSLWYGMGCFIACCKSVQCR